MLKKIENSFIEITDERTEEIEKEILNDQEYQSTMKEYNTVYNQIKNTIDIQNKDNIIRLDRLINWLLTLTAEEYYKQGYLDGINKNACHS